MANFDFKDKYDINDLRKIIEILRSEMAAPGTRFRLTRVFAPILSRKPTRYVRASTRTAPKCFAKSLATCCSR